MCCASSTIGKKKKKTIKIFHNHSQHSLGAFHSACDFSLQPTNWYDYQ